MFTYTTFEIRRTLRNIPFALYTIIFPAGFYLLFTVVFGGASQHSYAAHYMVSMALYGGALETGARDGGGFAIHAHLPLA